MKQIPAMIIGLAFIVLVGWYIAPEGESLESGVGSLMGDDGRHNPTPLLPSQSDIQQALVDRGYDIKIDGVIGAESRKAWDAEINNQFTREYFQE